MKIRFRVLPCRQIWVVRGAVLLALVAFAGGTTNAGIFSVPCEQPLGPNPAFARQVVAYPTHEQPGTIIVDPANHFLYFIHDAGRAIRYGVGVGAEGFIWSGRATVHSKQEWPDWHPPAEMLARKPELRQHMVQLQSGIGMKAVPIIRSEPEACTSGAATRTRSTASTAPTNPGPSAIRPAASA
jgi:lipoprotein-anchoring transpeptidase ErfK/SrfK